jgi:hypothetical protein
VGGAQRLGVRSGSDHGVAIDVDGDCRSDDEGPNVCCAQKLHFILLKWSSIVGASRWE